MTKDYIRFSFPVVYMGTKHPDHMHLEFVKNRTTGEKFELLAKIAMYWESIGHRLGILHAKLMSIEDEQRTNIGRVRSVLNIWISNASGLPNSEEFPLSWQGLWNILESIGKRDVAQEYFDFMERL